MEKADLTVTVLLKRIAGGDQGAWGLVLPVVYDHLRATAHRLLRNQAPGHTLQTTALVHEAYMKLVGAGGDWESRRHFECVAARAMRQVLVDHARAQHADKRGGAGGFQVLLTEELAQVGEGPLDALALDEALTRLQELDPEVVSVFELRCFGGLDLESIARVLGLSLRTVERRWRFVRAWLAKELEG